MNTYELQRLILSLELMPVEKLVGMALALHLNAQTESIRVRQDTIAKECGYSIATVKRAIRSLIAAGVFTSKRTGRSSILCAGQGKSTGIVEGSPVTLLMDYPRAIRRRGKAQRWELDTALSTVAEERVKREIAQVFAEK